MAMNTTDFNNITLDISRNIKILVAAAAKTFDKEYPMIVKKEKTDLAIEKQMRYEGPGAAAKKAEGDDAATTRIYESNIETIAQSTFVHDMPITWEQRKFAVKNAKFMNVIGVYLTRSLLLRYEYESANVLNNAFSSSFLGGDSQPYASATHSWKSGGTYSNLLTAAVLSKTALETALKTIANAKMENEVPAALKAGQVNIAYSNILTLPELLKSTLDPTTANNTYNAIQDFTLKKNLNHYLSSDDDWSIDTNTITRTLYEAHSPEFTSYMNDSSDDLVQRGKTSIGAGFHDQIGTYLNAGS